MRQDILLTIKTRGKNGRFKTAKSFTAEELLEVVQYPIELQGYAWYDRVFRTRRYIAYHTQMAKVDALFQAWKNMTAFLEKQCK